jgi:Zn-dependent M28 family amino/carboxypeptidase
MSTDDTGTRRRSTGWRTSAAVVSAAALALAPATTALAGPKAPAGPAAASNGCANANNNTYAKVTDCITLDGVREHQAALQAVADANGGTRASGTPGYTASVDYVASTLRAAGWEVSLDPFPFTFVGLPTLTAGGTTYESGQMTGSGTGTRSGAVVPVDINLAGTRASTSGCEAADFAGFTAGSIALIQRGTCDFGVKAANAQAAGAAGVIIFNQGNDPTRVAVLTGTLLPTGAGTTIPVVGASFDTGAALAASRPTATINVPAPVQTTVNNVIAEKRGTNDANVVMAGAHLDSVQVGPGINDNGSGSAALLEFAQTTSKLTPENTVRLAFWAAEENGLLGSTDYVNTLSAAEKERIALYLNFDMIGSPNHVFFVYDSDQSSFNAPAGVTIPEGSVQIEDVFESFFTSRGVPYEDSEFSGRSDYQAFINNGIPSGGLFTGAEVPKTAAQAAIWGGTAGAQYDPCYHLACDDYDNVNLTALDVNSDAVAYAILTYAYSTESVNGVKGKMVPGSPKPMVAPAGPEGTVGKLLAGGGGLAHDHLHGDDITS